MPALSPAAAGRALRGTSYWALFALFLAGTAPALSYLNNLGSITVGRLARCLRLLCTC
jgi:hypothetical protein